MRHPLTAVHERGGAGSDNSRHLPFGNPCAMFEAGRGPVVNSPLSLQGGAHGLSGPGYAGLTDLADLVFSPPAADGLAAASMIVGHFRRISPLLTHDHEGRPFGIPGRVSRNRWEHGSFSRRPRAGHSADQLATTIT